MAEQNQMSQNTGRAAKDPGGFRRDLNPEAEASQDPTINALEIKPLKLKLQRVFQDGLIGQLEVLPPGAPLKEGGVYLDLMDSDLPPFTVHEKLHARDDQWLIAKTATPFEVWNVLKGHYIT